MGYGRRRGVIFLRYRRVFCFGMNKSPSSPLLQMGSAGVDLIFGGGFAAPALLKDGQGGVCRQAELPVWAWGLEDSTGGERA